MKTVYLPVEEIKTDNEIIQKLQVIKNNLEDVYSKLLDVNDYYNQFRELDIMIQKVEEAILWSHRVMLLEHEENKKQECCSKGEDCDVDRCCKNAGVDNVKKIIDDFKDLFKEL